MELTNLLATRFCVNYNSGEKSCPNEFEILCEVEVLREREVLWSFLKKSMPFESQR